MKEQKILATWELDRSQTSTQKTIESILEQGWLITSITPQGVGGGGSGYPERGGFLILFERIKL